MLARDQPCFNHPTKVTFTFADKGLRDNPANHGNCPSFWTPGSPYRDKSSYNMQKWLAIKMKEQRDKLKLERAVSRAERKLQIEYDKQMEEKKKAAADRFKAWLKAKGFADQSPVMLHRHHHSCLDNQTHPPGHIGPPTTPSLPHSTRRPRTARVKSNEGPEVVNDKPRPKSASTALSRKARIISTMEPPKTQPSSKSLGQNDYMKMRHLAGKRYKKLKEEQPEFQCEDQLLRKLQSLDWEEKCIKKKMVLSEKENMEKLRKKALRRRKKKTKFSGDVITVEVEELDNADEVEITFEEVDDQCSDIGCIEKEGVDFHIESRETIDLSDKPEEIERPKTAEPTSRPKTSKPRKTSPAPKQEGKVKDTKEDKTKIEKGKDTKEKDAKIEQTAEKTAKSKEPKSEKPVEKAAVPKKPESETKKPGKTTEKKTSSSNLEEKKGAAKKVSVEEQKPVAKKAASVDAKKPKDKEEQGTKGSPDKVNEATKTKSSTEDKAEIPKIVVNESPGKASPKKSDATDKKVESAKAVEKTVNPGEKTVTKPVTKTTSVPEAKSDKIKDAVKGEVKVNGDVNKTASKSPTDSKKIENDAFFD